ncbi:MAG TPA: cation transporter, partial [Candidatus Marinimicrobia bacterium]|nr:cation transporter [Candidatus Neomarinimicrobiota bacterium]
MSKTGDSSEIVIYSIRQQLIWLIGLLVIFSASFLFASWRMQSLIVRIAAGLILTDLAAAASVFMAYRFARRDLPMRDRTPRFIRSELIVTFISSLILIGYGVRIALDIPGRFRNPVLVNYDAVFILTGAFLLINILSGWLMKKILNKGGFSLRLISVITMTAGGFFMLETTYKHWDPVIAILMILLFIVAVWDVYNSVARLLQQGVPTGINVSKIIGSLKKTERIKEIFDAQLCWKDEGLHFTARIDSDSSFNPVLRDELRHKLSEEFGLDQSILEIKYLQ